MSKKKGISIIIPVLNEEDNIDELVQRLVHTMILSGYSFEVIFIDDNSVDKTVLKIKEYRDDYPIKIKYKKGVPGKAQSILEGVAHAKYDYICMIDADLQYPPEAIRAMMSKIEGESDVVIAKRKDIHTSLIRKIISKTFNKIFCKFLHDLDYDVQSGLKIFKKEIVERVVLKPYSWSFDLEFLLTAKAAGYKLAEVDIKFTERVNGDSKINLVKASVQIGLSAILLKLNGDRVIPFHKKRVKAVGHGFHYKQKEFIHYSNLNITESAVHTLLDYQGVFLFSGILIFIAGLFLNWKITLMIIISLVTVIYFIDLLFNLFLIYRTFKKNPEINIDNLEIKKNKKWPTYTIFCPLYKEWKVVSQFVKAIDNLDYPKNKLQVQLLLEEDDKQTIEHIKQMNLPKYFEIIIVPHTFPKTKPKACNYGLRFAKGKYAVIYDAEDIPDPLQLKQSVVAFEKLGKNTACIQAKLNYYNKDQNLLTRLFTAEYSLWFDLILTGLQSLNAPIPLGGTSNHFKVEQLREVKGWDSFNVTEDCDLGIRLAKKGYLTAIINSITLEEANSDFMNWINQRSRWIKGYIQTYLVHMRRPHELITNGFKAHFLTFQLVVGGKILALFINPFMWILTIIYFSMRATLGQTIEEFFPGPIFYMGVFSLIFGNFLYLYYYMIACAKKGQYSLIKFIYLVPFYWIGMSIAAWKGLIQLIFSPHYWPKTKHGLHFYDEPEYRNSNNEGIYEYKKKYVKILDKLRKLVSKPFATGGFLLSAMMISNVLNLIFNAYLGKAVSFVDFGVLTLINTFWYVVSILVSALSRTVNHHVAFLTEKYSYSSSFKFLTTTVKKFFFITSIAMVLWLIMLPFLPDFFNESSIIPFISFAPVIVLAPLTGAFQGYLNGRFLFVWMGIILILTSIYKLLSAILFVSLNLGTLVYLSIPISIVLAFITTIAIFFRFIKDNSTFTKGYSYTFPKGFFIVTLVNSLATTAFLTLDLLLVKHYLSPELAGRYAFLSLIGKIIFFFGSLLNIFAIPIISRDIGANRNPIKNFYKLLLGTTLLTSIIYITILLFGTQLLPIVFGDKILLISQYLPYYSLAIAFFVINSTIITYHLIRHHYTFPFTAIVMTLFMLLSIIFFHESIEQIIMIVLITSITMFVLVISLHLLQRNGRFFVKNLIDLLGLFLPLPEIDPSKVDGKRILIFNWRDTKHKLSGGAEAYIHELAKRWVKMGNQVTVFCGNDSLSKREELIDGVQIIRRGGFYFVYVWAMLYYLFKFRGKYDVIIDSENGIPFFTPLYASEKKFLLIHHVHQEVFRKSLTPPLSWIADFLEIKFMPYVYKNLQVITVSDSSRKEIVEKALTTSVPKIIHNGIDLNKYKLANKSKIPTVLYLGRLKYYKSLHIFIHSAMKIIQELPMVKFIIAGDGEEKIKLITLAKKIGIYDKIEFVGKVSEEEKIKLYQRAWVFVNPSFMEGWGITTIEANACGTPVVASDVPGLRDSVKNPHTGILVKYGDIDKFSESIIKIIEDNKLRRRMSKHSREWAINFDWEKSAKNCLEIFK